jgi:hypothetical protein
MKGDCGYFWRNIESIKTFAGKQGVQIPTRLSIDHFQLCVLSSFLQQNPSLSGTVF